MKVLSKYCIGVFFLGLCCLAQAQVGDTTLAKYEFGLSALQLRSHFKFGDDDLKFYLPVTRNTMLSITRPRLIFEHQPFFCRIESNIERKSILAPRFRLGSLDYVNWLEGKN